MTAPASSQSHGLTPLFIWFPMRRYLFLVFLALCCAACTRRRSASEPALPADKKPFTIYLQPYEDFPQREAEALRASITQALGSLSRRLVACRGAALPPPAGSRLLQATPALSRQCLASRPLRCRSRRFCYRTHPQRHLLQHPQHQELRHYGPYHPWPLQDHRVRLSCQGRQLPCRHSPRVWPWLLQSPTLHRPHLHHVRLPGA